MDKTLDVDTSDLHQRVLFNGLCNVFRDSNRPASLQDIRNERMPSLNRVFIVNFNSSFADPSAKKARCDRLFLYLCVDIHFYCYRYYNLHVR